MSLDLIWYELSFFAFQGCLTSPYLAKSVRLHPFDVLGSTSAPQFCSLSLMFFLGPPTFSHSLISWTSVPCLFVWIWHGHLACSSIPYCKSSDFAPLWSGGNGYLSWERHFLLSILFSTTFPFMLFPGLDMPAWLLRLVSFFQDVLFS